MKFVAARPALATAVKIVAAAAGGSLPICSGIRLDVEESDVVVTCTNLDLTIRARVAMTGGEQGSAIVPAIFLNRFLSTTDGGIVSASIDDGRLHVESGEASITLATLSVDDWPKVTVAHGEPVELSPLQVAELRKVVGYADDSSKAPNPLLRGVCFSGHIADASDRYRFARADLDVEVPGSVVIPADALEGVLRNASGPVTYVADDRRATFTSGSVEWTTVVIEGEFPSFDKFVHTKHAHDLTMSVERLAEAVRRVRILSEGDDSEGIVVTVDGGKAILRNRDVEQGEVVDVVPCDGDVPWPVVFRGKFLAELLDNADDETITFGFEDSLKPIQVSSERLTQVVMPVITSRAKK